MTRGHERGSVLLLLLGCVVVGALLLAVVADASALFLTRRSLSNAADGAALAGAQAADLMAVYEQGTPGGRLPLDRRSVEATVVDYLARTGLAEQFHDLHLVAVETDGVVVAVTLTARARLPLVTLVTAHPDGVPITVTARSRSVVLD